MVLAVQSYSQFHPPRPGQPLGAIINVSVVRELGPVLAATMLAGRVGSAMAAELATMRITEQIDALACLGVNPLHYLVAPALAGLRPADSAADHPGQLHGRHGRGIDLHPGVPYRGLPLLAALPGLRRAVGHRRRPDQADVLRRRPSPSSVATAASTARPAPRASARPPPRPS